jgi:hypothetical protein
MKTTWTFLFRSVRSSRFGSLPPLSGCARPGAISTFQYRSVSEEAYHNLDSWNMAPKFELKTPKGTKDCELCRAI